MKDHGYPKDVVILVQRLSDHMKCGHDKRQVNTGSSWNRHVYIRKPEETRTVWEGPNEDHGLLEYQLCGFLGSAGTKELFFQKLPKYI